MTKGYTIGIDLGTTYSCVGIWEDDHVEIILNDEGNPTTPSYVSFTENERLIGEEAKDQAAIYYENTIYDAKRMIGRTYDDEILQNDIKHWPFKVIEKIMEDHMFKLIIKIKLEILDLKKFQV